PEADVVQLRFEVEASRLVQQAKEVKVVGRRVGRHGSVEEEAFADVDPSEELPVALELGLHDAVRGGWWEALEERVQLLRPQHGEHHALVEVPPAAVDAHAAAHQRLAAVAADDVPRSQLAPPFGTGHLTIRL